MVYYGIGLISCGEGTWMFCGIGALWRKHIAYYVWYKLGALWHRYVRYYSVGLVWHRHTDVPQYWSDASSTVT